MTLQQRISILLKLNAYLFSEDPIWIAKKEEAYRQNQWFIPLFIEQAIQNIGTQFLNEASLRQWAAQYQLPEIEDSPKTIGIVMAGNIPLVGFHDFLSVFLSGHKALIKASSKDEVLIKFLVQHLINWAPELSQFIQFEERLNGADAYIATGSNNTSRYFEYYFGKYPHIIRKNRTSVAILTGNESEFELEQLADDIQLYFGLGCRNVTQLFVPKDYDFIPLLTALKKYGHFLDYHKYKHNYDYHLALLIMGNKYYMNNDSIVLTENPSPFSPVSQVHYQFYEDPKALIQSLEKETDIQCIVGKGGIPFGKAQSPGLMDYADGEDTMKFLTSLS